jgi:hypothetical protein
MKNSEIDIRPVFKNKTKEIIDKIVKTASTGEGDLLDIQL